MRRPPDNEIAVAVPIAGIVNRSDELVIALCATRVYSSCVAFEFAFFKRVPTVSIGAYGFGRPETGGSSSAAYLLGFEWSDGTISSNMPLDHGGGLHNLGGGGGPHRSGATLFLDHLPPTGPFSVITAWPYFDLPERQVSFDATPIIDAARTVEPLWDVVEFEPVPRTREERQALDAAAVLVMPRTGWFGKHFDPTPPPPLRDEHGNELHFQQVVTDSDGNRIQVPPAPSGWRLANPDGS